MLRNLFAVTTALAISFGLAQLVWAAEEADTIDDLAAGHSKHGEAFNEGPRQQAYLMPGTGPIKFEVSSDVPNVQAFVEQGIGQLHGFWYFEAERSFRQAAMLDPNCAIAYWGMAFANANNDDRAKEFIQNAMDRLDYASPREQAYIKAFHSYLTSDEKRKQREAAFVEALEDIVEEYPDDLEAKAFLGFALYKYRGSADKSHAEVDVVLDQVLAKEKQHPVHHYRIHLWDHKSPQRALDSAAKCGTSARGIAHMWHMCGHIYSRVKRYDDASWFQEASARVDHRHMMHNFVLPDQIHNFAHNNEWLIRNLTHVGRIRDAVDLAKNMIELPRHPKYNMLDKRRSASYGRDRLMDVLDRFELWEAAISFADTPYLESTDDPDEQAKRLKLLGEAFARSGKLAQAHDVVHQLEALLDEHKAKAPTEEEVKKALQEKEADKTDEEEEQEDEAGEEDGAEKKRAEKVKKELKKKKDAHDRETKQFERQIAHVSGYLAVARGEAEEGLTLLEKAEADKLSLAQLRVSLGDHEKAVDEATRYAKDRKRQVQPLAGLVEVCWKAGLREEARKAFVRLRAVSNRIELGSPVFERIQPIAEELGYGADFRVDVPVAADLVDLPGLDTLGPFRWQPIPAPDWILPDSDGKQHTLRDFRQRPVIVVFYLGYGCLHCAEQLQALAPKAIEFAAQGISIVAISTDNVEDLHRSHESYEGLFPFPLVADPKMEIFKSYRVYDDFEDTPLHGTFLIDASGRIRWQDISYDPFMDVDFLLAESKRLLAQDEPPRPRDESQLANAAGE